MFNFSGSTEEETRMDTMVRAIVMTLIVVCSLVGVMIVRKGRNEMDRQARFTGPHGQLYTCSVGMFINAQGCLYCPKGNFCNQVDLVSPLQCGVGTYQDKTGQKSCPLAPAGSYADKKGMIAAKKCAPGSFQPNAGQTTCILAHPGTFVPTTGQTGVSNCQPNFFQPLFGQTSCVSCPPGEVQPLPGQTSCVCAPSNTSSLAAAVRTNNLAKLTYLASTGCPGSLFLRHGIWWVGSARACVSGKAGVSGRPVNISSLWMSTAIATTASEVPEYYMYQSGATIMVKAYNCNSQNSCPEVATYGLNNLNRFHLVFQVNVAYKTYTAMVPTHAQALAWAMQGYAPAFRILGGDKNWYYFDLMTAMRVETKGKKDQYVFYGTFSNRLWLRNNVRYGIFFEKGTLKQCCKKDSGSSRTCEVANARVEWFDCKTSNFEFLI